MAINCAKSWSHALVCHARYSSCIRAPLSSPARLFATIQPGGANRSASRPTLQAISAFFDNHKTDSQKDNYNIEETRDWRLSRNIKLAIAETNAPPAMAPLIDSHIHLWPSSASNNSAHAWMTPELPLTKPHELEVYLSTASSKKPDGVIYIETDRSHANQSSPEDQVLLEAKYLGEVCQSEPGKSIIKGIVPWCPVSSVEAFTKYAAAAREAMGAAIWDTRVKGFRYLFQAIRDREEFEHTVLAPGTFEVMSELGKLAKAFDIGVDQRSGGVWQLEVVDALISVARGRRIQGEAMIGAENAESGCCFVINHLCKPSFVEGDDFEDWKDAIAKLARHKRVYMKLSGAFSELQPPGQKQSAEEVYSRIKPWVQYAFQEFGAQRVMFGSDWPVCNLGGPGEEETWSLWREVVQLAVDDPGLKLSRQDKERVWGGTAIEAYSLDA